MRAEDAGRYSCKASNEVGEDWLHYELMVLSEWPALGWEGGVMSAGSVSPPPPNLGVTVGNMVWQDLEVDNVGVASLGSETRQDWVQTPSELLPSCVTLSS